MYYKCICYCDGNNNNKYDKKKYWKDLFSKVILHDLKSGLQQSVDTFIVNIHKYYVMNKLKMVKQKVQRIIT